MDWKKIFAYMTTAAKIISFVSLVLSVVVKVKMLIASSNFKNDDEDTEEKSPKTESGKNESES